MFALILLLQVPQVELGPATETALLTAAVFYMAKMGYELVTKEKDRRAGSGGAKTVCNYPQQGGGCVYASKDFSDMRRVEIIQGLGQALQPSMDEQTALLTQIRDGVRDFGKHH